MRSAFQISIFDFSNFSSYDATFGSLLPGIRFSWFDNPVRVLETGQLMRLELPVAELLLAELARLSISATVAVFVELCLSKSAWMLPSTVFSQLEGIAPRSLWLHLPAEVVVAVDGILLAPCTWLFHSAIPFGFCVRLW